MSWSSQNIDRTVSIYRAAMRTGRTLAIVTIPGEALFQDRHPFQFALPLADQQRSWFSVALPRRRDWGFKRTAFGGVERSAFRLADNAQRRFVGTAECCDLDLIRQDLYMEVPVAGRRRELSCAAGRPRRWPTQGQLNAANGREGSRPNDRATAVEAHLR